MSEAQTTEKTYAIEEVMERLSLKRSEVYRKVNDKQLKATKADHLLQFAEADLKAYEEQYTAEREQFEKTLDQWLGLYATRLEKHGETELPDLSEKTADERVAELARRIVLDGILIGANDIYVDPLHAGDRLLYRFEGQLKEIDRVDRSLSGQLKTKLKALAALTSVENQVVETIFRQPHKERSYQIRMTAAPTLLGEHLHLFFYEDEADSPIDALGYTPEQVTALQALLTGQPGLFLMIGPADVTANRHRLALANELSAAGRLVVSLEHHVQYRSESLVQLEVAHDDPQNFDAVWRTALGMSPEALFIDEVRDAEKAQVLIEAAYSGAVVVAQMRAPGAAEALTQLFELKLNRDSLARVLLGLVERMGLRRLCPHCRKKRPIQPQEADLLNAATGEIWEEAGCEICGDGFLGRRMLFGLWPMDEKLAAYIRTPDSPVATLEAWRSEHPLSLRFAAREGVLAGNITFKDVRTLFTGKKIQEQKGDAR